MATLCNKIISLVLLATSVGGCAIGDAADHSEIADASSTSDADASVKRGDGDPGYTTPADAGACWLDRPNGAYPFPVGVTRPSSQALQLEFRLEGHRLLLQSSVARSVAPTWTTEHTQIFEEEKTSGFWFETRTADGTLTFQGTLYDPLGTRREGMPDPNDADSGFFNATVCAREGASFKLEIPNDVRNVELRLYGTPLHGEGTATLVSWYALPQS